MPSVSGSMFLAVLLLVVAAAVDHELNGPGHALAWLLWMVLALGLGLWLRGRRSRVVQGGDRSLRAHHQVYLALGSLVAVLSVGGVVAVTGILGTGDVAFIGTVGVGVVLVGTGIAWAWLPRDTD